MNYPPAFFASFLDALDPALQSLLITLLTLLSRLSAHSVSSGHTPPSLSPLFGPLLFGLGHSPLSFHHAYHQYLRTSNVTQHLTSPLYNGKMRPAPVVLVFPLN